MYTCDVDTPDFIDDPVQLYLSQLSRIPPLTRDEEADLSEHVLANDQHAEAARKRLIEGNLAMVVSAAERYGFEGSTFLDLVISGNDGLLLALKIFVDAPSRSFSVHAANCVELAIAEAFHIADSSMKSERGS